MPDGQKTIIVVEGEQDAAEMFPEKKVLGA
jgi:hypothetical protein